MQPRSRPRTWTAIGLGVAASALAACAIPLAPSGQVASNAFVAPPSPEDQAAALAALAHPPVVGWAASRISGQAIALARAALPPAAPGDEEPRGLLALGAIWDASATGFAGSAATGKITSAAAYSPQRREAFWLTETGWLLARHTTTGAVRATNAFKAAFPGDTFPKSALTLSFSGQRLYACSLQGRFYAIDAATGANLAGSPVALGGTAPVVVAANVAAPPWIDVLASVVNGTRETVYALNHLGGLARMYVNDPPGAAPPTVTHVQTYDLPRINTFLYTEYFRSSPVVLGGKAAVGVWRRHNTTSALDQGALVSYDTGAATATLALTAGATISRAVLPAPVWAAPAVEVHDALTPRVAFVPTGFNVSMIDLATGDQAQTVPLIVNKTAPVRGVLQGYVYGAGGVSTRTLNPEPNGTVAVADAASLTLPLSGSSRDNGRIYSANRYNATIATPIWGYAKFRLRASDLVVAGTKRSVVDASLRLRCNATSFGAAFGAPNMRIFRLASNLLTDPVWSAATITPASRPGFEDGQGFTLASLAGHTASELGAGPTSYLAGTSYNFPAKGHVGTPDRIVTLGFAHPGLPYADPAFFGLLIAPRFDGTIGTQPQLNLTLSGEGFALPSMSNPVVIDSLSHKLYAANANALFAASWGASAASEAGAPWSATAFGERKVALLDDARTEFALTRLGQDTPDGTATDAGPVATVAGVRLYESLGCSPTFEVDGSAIYVLDNHATFNRVSLNRFLTTSPPTLDQSWLLSDAGGDARVGAAHLAYDYTSRRMFIGTSDRATATGRAWIFDRF